MKIKNYLDKILIAIVIIVIIIIGIYNKSKENNVDNSDILNNVLETNIEKFESKKNEKFEKKTKIQDEEIYAYITGCVKNPGVYKLNSTSRVKDLIDKSGGFCKDADLESINLSQKLKDEMKIHVNKIGEVKNQKSANHVESTDNEQKNGLSKININTASKEQLMTLPGVGSSRADEIIKYRSKNRFQSIEDIQNISGIGQKSFEKIKEKIIVD
ncbi:ComEA family DNA-binding protein [Helcococcus ovis]|uniref:DUF655 domain-containing protein n=3 Tax=Bacteria TaxID=2 RepID=A0A4V3IYB6_9FIRM|nr:ComEA family DNA-binding protein [Helcococcus ovis]TFF64351.1 DUF655 domain-containing protein [Helcococcus ovis]TFF66485.1 DUF655 domain-containing protein [Helcococcus ovis]TFF67046.1 DUF655 domain-containing protein [Helcococcus ovis]WNZ01820.1 ComEA family DNA-binding protein [Helcococcus ovis]